MDGRALQPVDLKQCAEAAARNIGKVTQTVTAGSKGQIFVLEEFHTSRAGQLQIAAMLVRLREQCRVHEIGLEGAVHSGRPLDTAWYQTTEGSSADETREDLGVRMVAEGEISAPEMMALVFTDVTVYGIELASEYERTLNLEANPQVHYLLAIAERSVSGTDVQHVKGLIDAGKSDEAFEYLLNADPWVKKRFEELTDADRVKSVEESVADIHELRAKAKELGADVEAAEEGIEELVQFYETANQRSNTMVKRMLQLPRFAAGAPAAMVIGAAHTARIAELLADESVAFAVLRPSELNPAYGSMSLEAFERKSRGAWARNTPGTLGHVLNAQRKPPPIVERTSGKSYASMNLAGMLLAKNARSGGRFPDDVWAQLSSLPGVRVDRESIERDGYDVIFRAWLADDNGREREVWARVGSVGDPGDRRQSLEEKLLKASKTLSSGGNGGKGGGNDGKAGAVGEDDGQSGKGGKRGKDERDDGAHRKRGDEGPGDTTRGKVLISRTSMRTLAVFGRTREDVKGVGRISI